MQGSNAMNEGIIHSTEAVKSRPFIQLHSCEGDFDCESDSGCSCECDAERDLKPNAVLLHARCVLHVTFSVHNTELTLSQSNSGSFIIGMTLGITPKS